MTSIITGVMEYLNKIANLQDYVFSNVAENLEMIAYSVVSFFVPFLLAHPPLLVGIIVTAMLITAALNLRGYKLLPVILLPSLGVLTAGLIFGPLSIFLVYFMIFL